MGILEIVHFKNEFQSLPVYLQPAVKVFNGCMLLMSAVLIVLHDCRFQASSLPLFVHIPYHSDLWYYLSMWRCEYKYLITAEAMHGHHLMARTGNGLQLAMHLCAVWLLGPSQRRVKLIRLMISWPAFMMACTGIWERLSLLMALGIYNTWSIFCLLYISLCSSQ